MRRNRKILDDLVQNGHLQIHCSPALKPPPTPLPSDFDFDKVEGMMLGLAIGDALGNRTESQNPHQRRHACGEIDDYLPNPYAEGQCRGLPSDDSQMAFWTLERLLADDGLDIDDLARCFAERRIFGIGRAVGDFVACYRSGRPWHECGARSAGNGALMRIAPIVIPHLRSATADLWVDTALAATLTHNDAGSTAACLAFVSILWQLFAKQTAPEPEWWLASYVENARACEGPSNYRPRGGRYMDFCGPIWRFVAEHVPDCYRRGLSTIDACDGWHSGAYLLETVPSVVYILMKHGHDPEQAIVRAVNDTRDNDTVAAIVGAAVGALHGKRALPAHWIDGLLGRTMSNDDGQVFRLLQSARARWEAAR